MTSDVIVSVSMGTKFNKELFESFGVDNVDEVAHRLPLGNFSEGLGVDVSTHSRRDPIHKANVLPGECLVQLRDRDTVRTSKVTHGGIATSFNGPNHRLVVLVKYHLWFPRKKGPP